MLMKLYTWGVSAWLVLVFVLQTAALYVSRSKYSFTDFIWIPVNILVISWLVAILFSYTFYKKYPGMLDAKKWRGTAILFLLWELSVFIKISQTAATPFKAYIEIYILALIMLPAYVVVWRYYNGAPTRLGRK